MSGWGTNGNANRIKDTYIKGFLDVSGGAVIVEKTSTLQIMAHDRDVPILEFKPEYFTVNTTSSVDISYSALAALSTIGVSFEESTVDVMNRIKYITTGSSGAPPNEILYTQIGNDDEKSQLQVYGRIKGHYGLEVDGDVSFNNRLYVNGDSSFNGNLVVGSDLSLNGNLYVVKRGVFIGDVSMNGNVDIGLGSSLVSINKDISAGYALDVSGFAMFRNQLSVVSDVSLGSRLTVVGDSSFNGNFAVGSDLSLNGNLYVVRRALFGADVSMNGNVDMGSGSSLVAINKDISAGYALDVSGFVMFRNQLSVVSDVSLGSRLTVVGDASFNGNVRVGTDLSLNGNLYVVRRALFGADVSMSGNVDMGSGSSMVAINKDISAGYALDVSGFAMFRNQLSVVSDVSFGSRLTVVGDASFNGNLRVGTDLSLNGNLYVVRRALFGADVSMSGNVDMGSGSSMVAINKDISAGYALDVSGFAMFRNQLSVVSDVSFGSRLTVVGDASFNGNLRVGSDLSLNGNLYVFRRALFGADVSMNGNVDMGSGSSMVAINKDISAGYALDVSGFAMFRNQLSVVSDVSLGSRLTVVGDSSFNGNLRIGSDLSLNGNLYVVKRSLFGADVSMNGNVKMGSGSLMVSINKDISAGYALDVSGFAMFRNLLSVVSDVSLGSRLTVVGDSSFNGNLRIGSDLSLNGNLYVVQRSLFGADVSMNGNVKMGSGSSMVSINKDISAGYALDVSGFAMFRNLLSVVSDVSLGSRLTVVGDSSFNGNLRVGSDLSLNGNLYVVQRGVFGGDVSLNGNAKMGSGSLMVSINKDISAGYALDVSGFAMFRNLLSVVSDVSLGSRLTVVGDSSFNGNLRVGSDLSLNGNLYVVQRGVFGADVSMNGNAKMGSGSSMVAINKDISAGYALDVSGFAMFRNLLSVVSDVSLGSRLTVVGDSSFNGNLRVGSDLSVNGNLTVVQRGVFGGDVSMNGNVDMGSGSSMIAINKDISAGYALDVSGFAMFRNQLSVVSDVSLGGKLSVIGDVSMNGNVNVAGTFTVNGLPVSGGGGSLTGNVQVGTNSGFVTINKPQFFSDPSLAIYYNFDTSYNAGTRIYNFGSLGSAYDASLNGTTTGMIDTTTKLFGTASLKNNPNANNSGVLISSVNGTFPVSSTMTFSTWIYKPNTPVAGTFDRIFEISDLIGGGNDNNSIALDISSSGIILPVLTYGGGATSCFTTISSSILTYNVCDGNWNHIVWQITPNRSIIYINGCNTQIDTITSAFPTTTRKSAYVGYCLNNQSTRDFSGNIDDFRYYKDKALSYAEIYQLYNNSFYTFDICGGFLANGSSVIYEPSGSKATANRGTLTLLHGDASGSSSIMFKSVNDPLEYGYIQYEENSAGSSGFHYGLMTIGIENDAGAGSQADRIALVPSGGSGFVGINTKTPQTSLDVSGTISIRRNLGLADLSSNPMSGGLIINSLSGRLLLGNYYTGGVGTRSAIQSSDYYDNIDHPMELLLNPLGGSVGVGTAVPSNFALDVSGIIGSNADANINSLTVGRGAGNNASNLAVGFQALSTNTSGVNNVAVGYEALKLNTSGINNVAVGYQALLSNTSGNENTVFGFQSMKWNTSGNSNVGVGSYALQNCISGANNTAIGGYALLNVSYSSHNVGIGREAGHGVGSYFQGDYNTYLGAYTSSSSNSWNNSTAIGTGAQITASYQIVLGTTNENIFVPGGSISLNNASSRSQLILKGSTTANSFVLCNGRPSVLTSSLFGIVRESATTTTNIPFQINTSENIGIGYDDNSIPSTSGYKLFVNSGVQATQFNATSDYREKENIIPLNEKYNIDVLNPVTYNLKSTGKQDVGFIAHEVQEFYPFLVTGEKDGPEKQSLNYNGFIGILTKEIKELKKTVAVQAERLTAQAEQIHSQAEQIHSQAEQIHSQAEQIHSQAEQIHSQAEQIHSQAEQLTAQEERIQKLEKLVSELVNK